MIPTRRFDLIYTEHSQMTRSSLSHPGPPAASELPDVLQFMRVLWAVVHSLQKASKRMAAELGVTGPQRLVLRVLGLFPGASAGTLASILHVHPSTLTGILQRLVAQGLLTRSADPADARRSVLELTARGRRVNAADAVTVESAVAGALKTMAAKDAAATRRVLTAIVERLDVPRTGTPRRAARRRPSD